MGIKFFTLRLFFLKFRLFNCEEDNILTHYIFGAVLGSQQDWILLILCLICSFIDSESEILGHLFLNHSSFLRKTFKSISFPLSTALNSFNNLWSVVFFIIPLKISSNFFLYLHVVLLVFSRETEPVGNRESIIKWVVFTKLGNFYPLFLPFFSLSFWDSKYMYFKPLEILLQVFEILSLCSPFLLLRLNYYIKLFLVYWTFSLLTNHIQSIFILVTVVCSTMIILIISLSMPCFPIFIHLLGPFL